MSHHAILTVVWTVGEMINTFPFSVWFACTKINDIEWIKSWTNSTFHGYQCKINFIILYLLAKSEGYFRFS